MTRLIERRQSTGTGTRIAFGDDAKKLRSPSLWSGTAELSPSLAIEADVAAACREIGELLVLDDDWDDEGADKINPDAVRMAQLVLNCVAQSPQLLAYGFWRRPSVAPLRSGGLTLSWQFADHDLLLIFQPGSQEVACIDTRRNRQPVRIVVTPQGAAYRLLVSLSNQ